MIGLYRSDRKPHIRYPEDAGEQEKTGEVIANASQRRTTTPTKSVGDAGKLWLWNFREHPGATLAQTGRQQHQAISLLGDDLKSDGD
jgi:hypothetical protein